MTRRPRKTVADLMALPEETRAELLGGEIYMAPAPTPRHQVVMARLLGRCLHCAETGRLGVVFPAPLDVELPSGDVVQPDLVFVKAENPVVDEDRIRGVPDLLVEIVSPSNPERDRLVKRDLYESNGVAEYWIVEPDLCAVDVLRLRRARYEPAGYFTPGTVLSSPFLPGLEIEIEQIFRR